MIAAEGHKSSWRNRVTSSECSYRPRRAISRRNHFAGFYPIRDWVNRAGERKTPTYRGQTAPIDQEPAVVGAALSR